MAKILNLKNKRPEGISDEFVDTVNSAGIEERKAMLVRLQNEQKKAEHFLKNDPTIQEKNEELKNLKGPCKDAIKVVKNRIHFILEELTKQGQVL